MCGVRLFSRNFETDEACALLLLLSDVPSSVGRLIFARLRNVFIISLMFQFSFAEHSMTCFVVAKSRTVGSGEGEEGIEECGREEMQTLVKTEFNLFLFINSFG